MFLTALKPMLTLCEEVIALAKEGTPMESFKSPKGGDRKKAQQQYQLSELERSIKYSKETLGLGTRS